MSSKVYRGGIPELPRHAWSRTAGAASIEPLPEEPSAALSGPEVDAIREALTSEFEARFQQERSRVYESGREGGRNEARQELQPQLERIARSLDELAHCRERYRKETERELVQLSIEIARRILRRELSVDSSAILGLLHSALESVSLREVLEVRVHPTHAETVRASLRQSGAPEAISIVGDGHLEPGAVLVETRRGAFDASADTQLDEIQRGFADLMERPDLMGSASR